MGAEEIILAACMCECIKIASPSASIPHFTKQFFGKDLLERLSDIDSARICVVMTWAANQEKYKHLFLEPKPHHAFAENYNRISFDHDHSKNKPTLRKADDPTEKLTDAEYQSIVDFYSPGSPYYRPGDVVPTREALDAGHARVDSYQNLSPELRASFLAEERLKALEKEKAK